MAIVMCKYFNMFNNKITDSKPNIDSEYLIFLNDTGLKDVLGKSVYEGDFLKIIEQKTGFAIYGYVSINDNTKSNFYELITIYTEDVLKDKYPLEISKHKKIYKLTNILL